MQWREVRYRIDSEKIHLVSSSVFADNLSAYSGDPIMTAVEFQREIVNNVIKTVRAQSRGKADHPQPRLDGGRRDHRLRERHGPAHPPYGSQRFHGLPSRWIIWVGSASRASPTVSFFPK